MRRSATALMLLAAFACERGEPAGRATTPPTARPVDAVCERREGGAQDAAMFLNAIRVGTHEGADRVTLEFRPRPDQPSKIPFHVVEPATPPLTEDASGETIEVAGRSFLRVIVWATGVDLSGDEPRIVFQGPNRYPAPEGSVTMTELVRAGDFENTLTFYVGLRERACFSLSTLDETPRIVVDLPA